MQRELVEDAEYFMTKPNDVYGQGLFALCVYYSLEDDLQ